MKIARVEAISGGFLVVPLQDGVVNFDLCRDRNNDKLTKQSVITPKVSHSKLRKAAIKKFFS